MHLDGWTFAFQVVNFLALAGLLWRFLYRPVQEGIARRQAAIAEALDQAERARAEAARLDAGRAEAERNLAADLARRRRADAEAAAAERERGRAEAGAEGERLLAEARARLDAERAEAERALRAAGAELAARLARRLLAGLDPAAVSAAFLPPLETALAALDPGGRRALADELARGAVLTVATAHELPAAERPAWSARLAAALGAAAAPRFVTDPALIAGVELRLPGHRVACHWAAQLERLRQEMGHGQPL